jgi:hypothetical protein
MLWKCPAVAEIWLTNARVTQLKASNKREEGAASTRLQIFARFITDKSPCKSPSTQEKYCQYRLAFGDDAVTRFSQHTVITEEYSSESKMPLLKR